MPRDLVADDTVQSGHKVPDDVRALLKCRRKPKVSVVIAAKFRWQYRLTGRHRVIEQRSDRLHIESEPRLRTLLFSEPHADGSQGMVARGYTVLCPHEPAFQARSALRRDSSHRISFPTEP